MEPKERIIVALDVDTITKAVALVEQLAPHVGLFKFGLKFINSMLASIVIPDKRDVAIVSLGMIRQLFKLLEGRVFWDGKFSDIPNIVAGASLPLAKMGVKMLSVHCLGGLEMMREVREAVEGVANHTFPRPLVLGVTILTSLDYEKLVKMGILREWSRPYEDAVKMNLVECLVAHLARLVQEAGLDGVIASPREIKAIREHCQPGFLIVTPGIRPVWAGADDQKRVMTPGEAIKAGADYLVIGRPITNPPKEIGKPVEAAKLIAEEIAGVVNEGDERNGSR